MKQTKMNTKLLKKVKLVCHGQALLGRASISFSPGDGRRLLLKKPLKNNAEVMKRTTKTGKTVIFENKTVKKRKKMKKKRPSGIVGAFSLFQGIPVFLKILFLGSKPNFLNQRITTTTCKRGTYNDFHPQKHKKSKPNPNPIQTQSKPNFWNLFRFIR